MIDFRAVATNLRRRPIGTIADYFGVETRGAEGCIDRLIRLRYFPFKRDGVMVEVGAARPDYLSIGNYYRRRGWRVISIEPNPTFAALHREAGNVIHEVACADYEADDATFQVVAVKGHSSVTYEACSAIEVVDGCRKHMGDTEISVQEIRVNIRKLDTILAAEGITHVDLLAVDVEGWEMPVLRGLSINPSVVVLENNSRKQEDDEAYMASRGYRYKFHIWPNYVYEAGK